MLQKNSKLLLAILFFLSFVFVPKTQAQMMGDINSNEGLPSPSQNQTQKYQDNLNDLKYRILKSQNINSLDQLDCKKVSNDLFENIGDAWMDIRIHNESAHERMDQMMGGEGSESLKQMHINMGRNYLGCSDNFSGMGMMFGSQNNSKKGGLSMMGFGNYGNMMGGFGVLGSIFWIVILIDLILLGTWLWKQIYKK